MFLPHGEDPCQLSSHLYTEDGINGEAETSVHCGTSGPPSHILEKRQLNFNTVDADRESFRYRRRYEVVTYNKQSLLSSNSERKLSLYF